MFWNILSYSPPRLHLKTQLLGQGERAVPLNQVCWEPHMEGPVGQKTPRPRKLCLPVISPQDIRAALSCREGPPRNWLCLTPSAVIVCGVLFLSVCVVLPFYNHRVKSCCLHSGGSHSQCVQQGPHFLVGPD